MKSISTVNPAIVENIECMIIEVYIPVVNLKSGLSLHFISSYFEQAKNSWGSVSDPYISEKFYTWSYICTFGCVTDFMD